jgi:hypothetical protein
MEDRNKNGQFVKGGTSPNKGKPMSEEQKKKLSEARKGTKHSAETIAKMKLRIHARGEQYSNWVAPVYCIDCGEQVKVKYRSKRCPKCSGKYHTGEKNPMWNGGTSFEPYTPDFNERLKAQIRERDDYTCQICELKQENKRLAVHHIDYNKKNCSPENLISLCGRCHAKTNSNREKWIEFFKEKKLRKAI